jgi:membrane-bound lytic murein transglycosylase D
MAKLKHMVLAMTSLVLAPNFSFAQSYTSNGIGLAIMNLNAATLKGKASSSHDIWARIRQDFRMTEVNPEIIRKHESYYSTHSAYFNRTVVRSQPYLYHIVNEAEKRQMPAEVALLPFIESAFVNKAKSPVGASGLWQFMPKSGRQYGLEQTNLYDGRHDVYAATDAALTYLQYLYGLFGDWSLALAAYNWGEGNVGKAVKRAQLAGIDPTYENLRMPNETRNYVPKLLAVRNIIDNPQAFGINLVSVPNRPYFETVTIDQPIDIDAAARLANISTSEFLTLNPSFKSPVFIPKENRKMLLPITAVSTFERNYRQADKDSLVSWNVYKAYTNTNIADLAAKSGMSTAEIKRLNNLTANTVPAGRSLLLSKNTINSQDLDILKNSDDDPLLNIAMSQPVLPPGTFATHSNTSTIKVQPSNVVVNKTAPSIMANTTNLAVNKATPVVTNTSTLATNTTVKLNQSIANSANDKLMTVASSQLEDRTTVEINAPVSNSNNDALMALVKNNDLQSTAAAAVKRALAQTERGEAQALRVAETRTVKNTDRGVINVAGSRKQSHKVVAGDSLFTIAQRYNVNVADLVTANNLRGHNIQVGQVLNITGNSNGKSNRFVTVAGKGNKTKPTNSSKPTIPATYTVKKGDTLTSIAHNLKIPVSKLQKVHGKQLLRPGQKLKLTGI